MRLGGLDRMSSRIANHEMQRSFLENVPPNRALRDLAETRRVPT
jgi:hypothetical protein